MRGEWVDREVALWRTGAAQRTLMLSEYMVGRRPVPDPAIPGSSSTIVSRIVLAHDRARAEREMALDKAIVEKRFAA